MNRIRVLHFHTLPVVSGSGINTFLTMKGTPADRFRVALACAPGGRLVELVRAAGMDVHEIPSLVQPLRPARDLAALAAMVRLLRRERIHVAHTHNSKAGFLGRLAARLARTPVVVHTVHGFAFHDAESAWRRRLFRALERMAADWADHTIFISQPLIEWADREGILRPGRYSKIYSGIDVESFRRHAAADPTPVRRSLGLGPGDRVVGLVAKLWEGKGHRVALEALARIRPEVPEARLLLVGEGPLEPELRRRAAELGVADAVVFAGFRTRIAEITAACDLCILPSFFEGMGRVLLEAGAAGRAVVASRVGGIPDVVEHGVTGLLVPPGDARALARAVRELLCDPERAARMGRAARERIRERFDAGVMARRIVEVYEACWLRAGGRGPAAAGGPALLPEVRPRAGVG